MIAVIKLDTEVNAELIVSKFQALGFNSKVYPHSAKAGDLKGAEGFILNGSAYRITPDSIGIDKTIYELGKPIMGICYGHQMIARDLGGQYGESPTKTFRSSVKLQIHNQSDILQPKGEMVYFDHNDEVKQVPEGFLITAQTERCKVAVMENHTRRIYGLQFHPENEGTINGDRILQTFGNITQGDLCYLNCK